MPVPEAAVDEDDSAIAREDQVGLAGQFAAVQAITIAEAVKAAADEQFGPGVLAPDAGHHTAAHLRTDHVGHGSPPFAREREPIIGKGRVDRQAMPP